VQLITVAYCALTGKLIYAGGGGKRCSQILDQQMVDDTDATNSPPMEYPAKGLASSTLCMFSPGMLWILALTTFRILQYMNILSIVYGINVSIVKLSIILQYLSIFVPHRKVNLMFLGCQLVIWSHFIFYTVATFFEIFICNPRDKFWSPLMTKGHCYNAVVTNIAAGSFNAFSDFVILLLPQHVIWKLQMRWERKVGVSAIFLTGFL